MKGRGLNECFKITFYSFFRISLETLLLLLPVNRSVVYFLQLREALGVLICLYLMLYCKGCDSFPCLNKIILKYCCQYSVDLYSYMVILLTI